MKALPLIASGTALVGATYGLARFSYGLFVPAFSSEFELTPSLAGVIYSGSFLAYCLAAVVAFRLADRPRWSILLAGVTAAGGSAVVAAALSPAMLAAGILIAGAGAGFASPGLVALVAHHVPFRAADRIQTVVNAGSGIGVAVGGPLALLLSGNWRTAWWLIALIAAVATTLTLLTDRPATGATVRAGRADGVERAAAKLTFSGLAPLRTAMAAAALAGAASAGVWTFGRSHVVESGGLAQTQATVFWVLVGIAGVAGAFSGDAVDRIGLRRSWMTTSALLAGATAAVGFWAGEPVAAFAAGAIFGGTYVALTGILIVWAAHRVPEQAAAGTAALFIALAVGQAAGAALLGGLLEVAAAWVVFLIAALTGVLSAFAVAADAAADERPRSPDLV
ncbi:MFS transporter [Arthrobacter monumenti]